MKQIKTAEFIRLNTGLPTPSPVPLPQLAIAPQQTPEELAAEESSLLQEYHAELRRLEMDGMSSEEAKKHLHKQLESEPAMRELRNAVVKEQRRQKKESPAHGGISV